MSSGAGLAAHAAQGNVIRFATALPLLAVALAGMALGLHLSQRMSSPQLRRGFAAFVIVVGSVLVVVNTPGALEALR